MAGKYRGVSYSICPKNAVLKQSLVACKYRGIDYIKKYCWRKQGLFGTEILNEISMVSRV